MSAYDIALNGLSNNAKTAVKAMENIVRGTTVTASADPATAPTDLLTLNGDTTTVESSLIDLTTAKHGYSASAKLIGVQREMDDALLNILS